MLSVNYDSYLSVIMGFLKAHFSGKKGNVILRLSVNKFVTVFPCLPEVGPAARRVVSAISWTIADSAVATLVDAAEVAEAEGVAADGAEDEECHAKRVHERRRALRPIAGLTNPSDPIAITKTGAMMAVDIGDSRKAEVNRSRVTQARTIPSSAEDIKEAIHRHRIMHPAITTKLDGLLITPVITLNPVAADIITPRRGRTSAIPVTTVEVAATTSDRSPRSIGAKAAGHVGEGADRHSSDQVPAIAAILLRAMRLLLKLQVVGSNPMHQRRRRTRKMHGSMKIIDKNGISGRPSRAL